MAVSDREPRGAERGNGGVGGVWGAKREEEAYREGEQWDGGLGTKLGGRGSAGQNREGRGVWGWGSGDIPPRQGQKDAEMRQRLEKGKISCWKISAVQNPLGQGTWGWDTPKRGSAPDKIPPPGQTLEFPKRGEGPSLSPVPVPHAAAPVSCSSSSFPTDLAAPAGFLLPGSGKFGGLQPWDLQGLREMGIFLFL